MTQPQHSPLPWHLGVDFPSRIVGADGYVVADADGVHLLDGRPDDAPHWGYEDGSALDLDEAGEQANADLIILAVNAHDALVEALRPFATFAGDGVEFSMGTGQILGRVIDGRVVVLTASQFEAARVAIALVES